LIVRVLLKEKREGRFIIKPYERETQIVFIGEIIFI
jgi:hypothetical protein